MVRNIGYILDKNPNGKKYLLFKQGGGGISFDFGFFSLNHLNLYLEKKKPKG